MTEHEKIILMLACGALHDIAEKEEKSAEQIKEVQKMIEKIIPNISLPTIPIEQ